MSIRPTDLPLQPVRELEHVRRVESRKEAGEDSETEGEQFAEEETEDDESSDAPATEDVVELQRQAGTLSVDRAQPPGERSEASGTASADDVTGSRGDERHLDIEA